VKIRRLPEIDLARISPLPKDQQRKHLEQIRYGRPPLSYGPFRSCFHDILNVRPEMFGPVSVTDWRVIDTLLRRKCCSEQERDANIYVARGLHEFARETKMLGRAEEFFPLAMGVAPPVTYWLPMVLSFEGCQLVPFIDPRRSRGLTHAGRRFALSMMHERIRAADPEYEAVRLAIFQFKDVNEDRRNLVIHTDESIQLFSFDEMEAMVRVTYELWREVWEEREMEMRRKSTGTRGSLL
jgi:hypothetical protein